MFDLKLVVFSPRLRTKNITHYYDQVFESFQKEWGLVFREIFGHDYKLYSNDFTRQDTIISLFQNDKCVAYSFLRDVDLSNPVTALDSWFGPWKPYQIYSLAERGIERGNVCSYLTVSSEYRKSVSKEDLPYGFIIGALTTLYFQDFGLDIMFGSMRNSRGTHKLAKMWGSELVEENVPYNGEPTNLVLFTREKIAQAMEAYHPMIHEMYNEYRNINYKEDRVGRVA